MEDVLILPCMLLLIYPSNVIKLEGLFSCQYSCHVDYITIQLVCEMKFSSVDKLFLSHRENKLRHLISFSTMRSHAVLLSYVVMQFIPKQDVYLYDTGYNYVDFDLKNAIKIPVMMLWNELKLIVSLFRAIFLDVFFFTIYFYNVTIPQCRSVAIDI